MWSVKYMPTLLSNRQLEKLAISVKIQKWTRPSKDLISKVNIKSYELGVVRLYLGEEVILFQRKEVKKVFGIIVNGVGNSNTQISSL